MVKDLLRHKPTRLFLVLGGFFIANALIAELMGVKLFSLENTFGLDAMRLNIFGNEFSFNLTAGVLLWPVVFIMTDIINEYYGMKGVRFLSFLTVGLISYTFIMFQGAIHLTPAGFWVGNYQAQGVPDADKAYRAIFGQSSWIIVGSLVAFLIGQVLDVFVFHKIKQATGEKRIWLRATGSTVVSQFVDSFVVLFIAFYIGPRVSGGGQAWSFGLVMSICVGNYLYKFVMAVVLTPVIYLVHGIIERYLGHEDATKMRKAAMGEGSEGS
ncbi:MAG: VUT family protein [Chitinophagaceae bacterium]|nr:MAG: VUT family protein [Chitinophagaceae bacterium]